MDLIIDDMIKSAKEQKLDQLLYQLDPDIKKISKKLEKKHNILIKKERYVVFNQICTNDIYIYIYIYVFLYKKYIARIWESNLALKIVSCWSDERETTEGIELPNQENIATFGEKENYKYLGISEAIIIKQTITKDEIRKQYFRRTRKLL